MTEFGRKINILMENNGFSATKRGKDSIWQKDEITSKQNKNQVIQAQIVFLERHNTLSYDQCRITIQLDLLGKAIGRRLKKRIQQTIQFEYAVDSDGDLKILFTYNSLKPSLIGVTIHLTMDHGHLNIQINNALIIGEIPQRWWYHLTASIRECVIPDKNCNWHVANLVELSIPIHCFALSTYGELDENDQTSHDALFRQPKPIDATLDGSTLRFVDSPTQKNSPLPVPVDILKIRETASMWLAIDQAYTLSPAGHKSVHKWLNKTLSPQHDSPNFSLHHSLHDRLMRQALTPDGNAFVTPLEATQHKALSAATNLLALSGLINTCTQDKNSKPLFEALSSVLLSIQKIYTLNGRLEPFQPVIAEILGDYWAPYDSHMAFKSWTIALNAKGHHPRLLTKMADFAQSQLDIRMEFKTRCELFSVEQRVQSKESIALRLIAIAASDPALNAQDNLLYEQILSTASEIIPSNFSIILAYCELLLDRNLYIRALSLLSNFVDHHSHSCRGEDLAKCHAMIGQIWIQYESNAELACLRFRQATTPPAIPSFDILERSARLHADHNESKFALGNIQTLLARGVAKQWYIDIIESCQNKDELKFIASMMLNCDMKQLPRSAVTYWQHYAARLALQYPSTVDQAIPIFFDQEMQSLITKTDEEAVIGILKKLQRFNELAEFLSLRLSIVATHDSLDLLTAALELAPKIAEGFLAVAARFISKDIDHGVTSIADETLMSKLYQDDALHLAKWHFLRRHNVTNVDQRIYHANQALFYWLKTDERPAEMIQAIVDVSHGNSFDANLLTLLERLCASYQQLPIFVEVLDTLIQSVSGPDAVDYMHWATRVVTSQLQDKPLAAALWNKWILHSKNRTLNNLFAAGYCGLMNQQFETSRRHFEELFRDPQFLMEADLIIPTCELYRQCKVGRDDFKGMIQKLIQLTGQSTLIDRSIDWQVASLSDLKQYFSRGMTSGNEKRLTDIAIQILMIEEAHDNVQTDQSAAGQILNEWVIAYATPEHGDLWWKLVAALQSPRQLIRLKVRTRCEVMLIYAKRLFEGEHSRLEALNYYESVASEQPDDVRTWIPLFSLYEETMSRSKLIAHLERIIPLIQNNKTVLERTPFNIETLRNALGRARIAANSDFEFLHQPSASVGSTAARDLVARPLDSYTKPNESQQALHSINFLDLGDPDIPLKLMAKDSALNISWRDMTVQVKPVIGSLEKIMAMAFASELEKHVAVQCMALINGQMQALDSWHWPVWRHPNNQDYLKSPFGRLKSTTKSKYLDGPLYKILRLLSPIIVRANESSLTLIGRYKSMVPHLQKNKEILGFDHPVVTRSGLNQFQQSFESQQVTLKNGQGLGAEVYLDLNEKTIYFDTKWQQSLPASILTHRALEQLSLYQRGYLGLVQLNATQHILPTLKQIKSNAKSSAQMIGVDREQLESFFGELKEPTERDIARIQSEMRLKSLQTVLATTLDVVGLLEGLTGTDLCKEDVLTPGKISDLHPLAAKILAAAATLNI